MKSSDIFDVPHLLSLQNNISTQKLSLFQKCQSDGLYKVYIQIFKELDADATHIGQHKHF
jgi:hypothetical protein